MTSYKSSSNFLKKLSELAIRITTKDFPNFFNAWRLITLDESPGVQTICISEVLGRVIGRSIMKGVKRVLRLFCGNAKLCLGRRSCIKHAYHAIGRQNAYNRLKRELALRNIRKLCPSIYTAVRNSHKTPSDLFIDMKESNTKVHRKVVQKLWKFTAWSTFNHRHACRPNVTDKRNKDDSNLAGSVESLRFLLDNLNNMAVQLVNV